MCKGVKALSNPVFGRSKKVAIPENKIKGGSNRIRLMRSSETKLWRAAFKSLVKPVIFHDGIGHSGDSVLTPGLIWLSQRPPCSLGIPIAPDTLWEAPRPPCQQESCDVF